MRHGEARMAAACRWCGATCTKPGGKIALASLIGHETRFKVTLPALAAAAPGAAAATSADEQVA